MDLKKPLAETVHHRNQYHSPIGEALSRTVHPKHPTYYGDGAGRDGYLLINNGGFDAVEKPNMMLYRN